MKKLLSRKQFTEMAELLGVSENEDEIHLTKQKMTLVDAAKMILLENANKALHYKDIYNEIETQGLWASNGKTPQETLRACLLRSKEFTFHGDNLFSLRVPVYRKLCEADYEKGELV